MREFHNDYFYMEERDGILFLFFKVDEIDLDLAKEIIEHRKNFTKDRDVLLYVDWTKIKVVDNKARTYLGKDETVDKLKAVAIYTDSVFSSFLANFILKVNLQNITIPKKIFTNKHKAILWLKSITTILMILFRIY